ncbi:tRNA 5-methylaminomethyl-2-thiouridine biosynthesis bifunctional protein MnmC [Polaromonas vacuolata]|uniref:tRNA 5-methylaminomethyl-2-thiouridine biosynthesis bifunctional protein MnmC n=1 Tax=Polaromonas vacuolata TaxID=37448 RepID=A0A6H2H9E7_9BURK|nr:FAD-dependent 5-carboxymethylaminomethyl-2-thiouridine(34) oxidoreductase MnmC [Polaromonas vacuolata]QJC56501.1 tRNA 5-methylaminomethyl-2-thiouridine biosynthesis bifunctional protein MnmC [Polaromonas vacuolata]
MTERIEWPKGGATSTALKSSSLLSRQLIDDIHLSQAAKVFLAGCGLPMVWRKKSDWRILEVGFGLGQNFLLTWLAWRDDADRPNQLHFVATDTYFLSAQAMLDANQAYPQLLPLIEQLQAQLWGLLPGMHRLLFEDGYVLLTLCVGDAKTMLQQQLLEVDSLYLNGFDHQQSPLIWDLHTIKAVASCCRRGTRLATNATDHALPERLKQCGFETEKTSATTPQQYSLQGLYNPAWEPRKAIDQRRPRALAASSCIVIGAGLTGAAIAASLSKRGWKVTVLDAAATPASGASGLPAGLLVPHISVDDSLLSKLSRSGARITRQQAKALLEDGKDWCHNGVLQRDLDGTGPQLPKAWFNEWSKAAAEWSCRSSEEQNIACGLSPQADGIWHASASWIKPAKLVEAWLKTPGVSWQGSARVASLKAAKTVQAGWQALDADEKVLAQADLVVIAAAFDSQTLAQSLGVELRMHPIRGQVSWGLHQSGESPNKAALNGHGSYTPALPLEQGLAWMVGASYERDCATAEIKAQDHAQNLAKLQQLLPAAAEQMQSELAKNQIHGWAGVRCATPSRLPMLTRLAGASVGPQVWVCSGMGSRGLTFSGLCAELLAAWLHAEPLPMEQRLVKALMIDKAKAS